MPDDPISASISASVSASVSTSTSTGDAEPSTGSVGFLHRVLDAVIQQMAGDEHSDEIARARKEYEARRGRVFEDEDLWERWTQAFLEWYALERVAADEAGDGRPVAVPVTTPAEAYLRAVRRGDIEPVAEMGAQRVEIALRAWLTSYRSLFEVRALAAERVELVDVLAGGSFSVAEKRAMAGVSVGDVAELRLVGFEDEVVFGRTFCFHPTGTRPAMTEHAERIRAAGGSRLDVVDYCASLRIRCERYRHVSPARVYEAGARELLSGDGDT